MAKHLPYTWNALKKSFEYAFYRRGYTDIKIWVLASPTSNGIFKRSTKNEDVFSLFYYEASNPRTGNERAFAVVRLTKDNQVSFRIMPYEHIGPEIKIKGGLYGYTTEGCDD